MPSSSDQTRVGRTLTLGGGAESSLEGSDIELSVSPKDIRTSPHDLCANRSDRRQISGGGPMVRIHFPPRRVNCEPWDTEYFTRIRDQYLTRHRPHPKDRRLVPLI